MDLRSVKSVSPNKNLFKKIMALVLSIAVFIISAVVIMNSNKAAKDTVAVLRVKSADGLAADVAIGDKDLEVYKIIRKEFTSDMVTSDQLEEIKGMYTSYYLRKGSVLYKDQLTEEKVKKNEWLYEMEDTHEAITIPYDYIECGGDILTPGDRIRVRAVYEGNTSYTYNSGMADGEYDPYAVYNTGDEEITAEIVFDEIVVKDLLNSNSHSIYEIYKEIAKLPEAEKQKAMKTEEFIKSVLPKALVLAATPEQVNTYALMKGNDAQLVITILSRDEESFILDTLTTLQSEVETWIEEQ